MRPLPPRLISSAGPLPLPPAAPTVLADLQQAANALLHRGQVLEGLGDVPQRVCPAPGLQGAAGGRSEGPPGISVRQSSLVGPAAAHPPWL